MTYTIITPPSVEPVTLADAKHQCRVDYGDDDTLIASMIKSARELAEHRTNRALVTQTCMWVKSGLCGEKIDFPVSPVQSITSITYLDTNGVQQTLPSSVYALDNTGQGKHSLRLKYGQSWPAVLSQFDAVKITFVAGYGNADAVPSSVKQWILMAVNAFYENRSPIVEGQTYELPESFCAGLLNTVKIWGV